MPSPLHPPPRSRARLLASLCAASGLEIHSVVLGVGLADLVPAVGHSGDQKGYRAGPYAIDSNELPEHTAVLPEVDRLHKDLAGDGALKQGKA